LFLTTANMEAAIAIAVADPPPLPPPPAETPPSRRPYRFVRSRVPPPSLYSQAMARLLARHTTAGDVPRLANKRDLERARRQLTAYLGQLPQPVREDIVRHLYKCLTYRQASRTSLDRGMYDNDLCCTYPDECSGKHDTDFVIAKQEAVVLWKILLGKTTTSLNLLPFMEFYHQNPLADDWFQATARILEMSRDNQVKMVETELFKNPKMVQSVQQVKFLGTYRSHNLVTWATLLPAMQNLQSIELHFWSCENYIELIKNYCHDIRELILSRQKGGRSFKETEFKDLPELVRNFQHSLRVLIVESGSVVFDQKIARSLQKALSETSQLELLKLEAEESPYLHWVNSRYQVRTTALAMTLRRSSKYLEVVRNVNRCFDSNMAIDLHYDTYVDVDRHKHAFFSQGPIVGGGENTVSQSTRDFEAGEVGTKFWRLMTEFGPRVRHLSAETDIRPEYFQLLFPNMESLEMFARASRKVPTDTRFVRRDNTRLKRLVMEADPAFSSINVDQLLLHVLGDVLAGAPAIEAVKILAAQSGLRVSEYSLLLRLNDCRSHLSRLSTVEFVSPYCISNNGLSANIAKWFLENCPSLTLLRDVACWTGDDESWRKVSQEATKKGLLTCWAEKTKKVTLYTIDYDAESWVQTDTGHKFELYNNLNDDWEVVEDEVEDIWDLAQMAGFNIQQQGQDQA